MKVNSEAFQGMKITTRISNKKTNNKRSTDM